jgi:cytidylate kinase
VSFVVTIDGPSGAGKSSTARAVAARLGILYLDTGALYRAVALRVLERGIASDDREAVVREAHDARLELSGASDEAHVILDGKDVSREIRTPEVSEMSSRLAAQPGVRVRLVEIQRQIAERGPLVAEGRDLGTVVFPNAEVKIFLDADVETRARRRARELQARGIAMSPADVREDLDRRDTRDRGRPESPLKQPEDAVVIDTTGMDLEQQVEAVLAAIRAHPRCPQAWRAPSAGRA